MRIYLFFILFFAVSMLRADEVRLQDGSLLKGRIEAITGETIALDTAYAGSLTIDRAQVASFSTDEPVYIRLENERVYSGIVQAGPSEGMLVKAEEGDIPIVLTAVHEGWLTPEKDPVRMKDRWNFTVAANFSGKSGNKTEKTLGANISAIRKGENTELKIYASRISKSSNNSTTSNESKAGLRYTSYFGDSWGWYARQEMENDSIENIRLRSVTAAGLSCRFFDLDYKKLSLNAGFSFRQETYQDSSPADQNLGLDFGFQHFYRFKNRFEIHNNLTYIPSVQDFANYLVTQNSYLELPLGRSKGWKVRMGLNNDYNSQPDGGDVNLNTTYYSGLVADWK